jgi:hypothetical protein
VANAYFEPAALERMSLHVPFWWNRDTRRLLVEPRHAPDMALIPLGSAMTLDTMKDWGSPRLACDGASHDRPAESAEVETGAGLRRPDSRRRIS